MTTTTKPKSVHAAQQYRDTMENAADSSREAPKHFGAATNQPRML